MIMLILYSSRSGFQTGLVVVTEGLASLSPLFKQVQREQMVSPVDVSLPLRPTLPDHDVPLGLEVLRTFPWISL